MRHAVRAVLALVLAGAAAPGPLRAQGDEAPPPAKGVLRLLMPGTWMRWDQRFGAGIAGRPVGQLEPLGIDFDAESLGTAQLPFLGPVQSGLRTVSGIGDYTLDLGRVSLALNANVRTLPLGLTLGVSQRLSIGVLVPLVRSRVEAMLRVDTAIAKAGNVGWNPGYTSAGAYAVFRTQVDTVLAALRAQAASGPLQAQAQSALDRYTALLCGLYGLGAGPPGDQASVCATAAAAAPFLPLASSAAGDSIDARLAATQADYATLAAAFGGAGVVMPAFTSGFALPTAALTTADFQQYLTDASLGVGGDSLGQVLHTRLGDIQVAATYAFAERASWHGSLTATLRLPTGYVDSERNFIDVGTGQHQTGWELASRNDVRVRDDLRLVASVRVGGSAADQLVRRVTPPHLPIAPLAQSAEVRRATGAYVGLDLTPTWRIDDAFSIGVRYSGLVQAATHYTYVDAADSARVGLPASVIDAETAQRWMRIGAHVTFSTLRRFAAGRASLPYSLTVGYQNTFWGRGGLTPQTSMVYLTLGAYFRLLGSGAERAAP